MEKHVHAGRWPFRPTPLWRRLMALVGLAAFTAFCFAALVAIVLGGVAVGALLLDALVG